MKRAFTEEHEFDEDAMPCPCEVCHGWFDLEDGVPHPRKESLIICEGCAHDIEKEIEKEEEIEECLSLIEDAKITIKYNNQRLYELGYRFPLPMKSVCAICGGTGIRKGGPTDSRPDEPCTCQIPCVHFRITRKYVDLKNEIPTCGNTVLPAGRLKERTKRKYEMRTEFDLKAEGRETF
jgi:hypothetical protein